MKSRTEAREKLAEPTLAGQVGAKAARKLKARRNSTPGSGLAWA
jgi:hypothetical protein